MRPGHGTIGVRERSGSGEDPEDADGRGTRVRGPGAGWTGRYEDIHAPLRRDEDGMEAGVRRRSRGDHSTGPGTRATGGGRPTDAQRIGGHPVPGKARHRICTPPRGPRALRGRRWRCREGMGPGRNPSDPAGGSTGPPGRERIAGDPGSTRGATPTKERHASGDESHPEARSIAVVGSEPRPGRGRAIRTSARTGPQDRGCGSWQESTRTCPPPPTDAARRRDIRVADAPRIPGWRARRPRRPQQRPGAERPSGSDAPGAAAPPGALSRA